MDTAISDPLVGRILDQRYLVEARVARGGMATVYQALDTRLDRTIALKVMHPAFTEDADFVNRFIREARAAARLSHPNVVAVFDQGMDDGTVFLAMEYVEGRTLRDVLREHGPLTPRQAFSVLGPMLAALAAAHQAGLVHRDVKPENVLLADDGRVKVADFGLARVASAQTTSTSSSLLMGTVAYLSPEQVEHGSSDARSDVYSAGIVLYELLTGYKPFDGDVPIQVAYQHVYNDVPPPSTLVPGLSPLLDDLVTRATARDPNLRPADAMQLFGEVAAVHDALRDDELDAGGRVVDVTSLPTAPMALPAEDTMTGEMLTGSWSAQAAAGVASGAGSGAGEAAIALATAGAPGTAIVTSGQAATDIELGLTGGMLADASHETAVVPRPFGGPDRPPAGPRTPRPFQPQPEGPPEQRKGLMALGIVLAITLIVSLGAWWLGSGGYATVPNAIGKSQADAAKMALNSGLKIRYAPERIYSDTVPIGAIAKTVPAAGERAKKGSEWTLYLSRGPQQFRVPPLEGMTLEEAQAALTKAHLTVGEVTEQYNGTVQAGKIIASTPAAGGVVARDSAVNLIVSKGPDMVPVPNVVGQQVDAAKQMLIDAKLTPKVIEEVTDRPELIGIVISQNPAEGTAARGSQVELHVGKAPSLITVPYVIGMRVGEAVRTLEHEGLKVSVINPLGNKRAQVSGQLPGAGEQVPEGSVVTIWAL